MLFIFDSMENMHKGKLSQKYLTQIYKNGWFKLFLPASLGGNDLPFSSGLNVLYEASSKDGSLGWTINLGAGGGYFYPYLNSTIAENLFSPIDAVLSGSGSVTGTGFFSQNDCIVSGLWNPCTGAPHATFFTANVSVGNRKVVTVVLFPHQVELLSHYWKYPGLINSGSWAIQLTNAKVLPEYVFSTNQKQHRRGYWIENTPFEVFARFCMISSVLGMVNGFYLKAPQFANVQKECFALNNDIQSLMVLADSIAGKGDSVRFNHLTWIQKVTKHFLNVCNSYASLGLKVSEENSELHIAFMDLLIGMKHPFVLRP
jgi:hypothetical protein